MATIQNITIDQDADYTETLNNQRFDRYSRRFNRTDDNK